MLGLQAKATAATNYELEMISVRRNPRFLNLYIAGVIIACWAVLGLFWALRRPPKLGEAARDIMASMREGDGTAALPFILAEEREENRLTPQSVRELHRLIIAPALARLGKPKMDYGFDYGHQGGAKIDFDRPNGDFTSIGATTYRRDRQPIFSLSSFVIGLWIAEALVHTKEPWGRRLQYQAVIDGLRRDGPTLKRLGWRTLFFMMPNELERFPLDSAERELQEAMAD
ncbi:MAG: hypothetical protein C4320_01650, partial [Armatimonadota bacterium]